MSATPMSFTRRTLAILLGMLMFTGLLGGLPSEHGGQHAEAATVHTSAKQRLHAMRVALAQRGDPYRYGAAGPNAFDCSGLTKFSYGRAGRSIPRTTDQQKAGLRPVARSAKRPGDIILFVNGGNAYHAAVYVGHGRIVHASHSGTPVKVDRIWTASYVVRRP
jgi:cell wall-associated NlpC family hydrolase